MVKNVIIKNSVIAIGNFDGVHKGHQEIFKNGQKLANKKKKKFGVLTFSPSPSEFFKKEKLSSRITEDLVKINLLKKNKVDFFHICKFNKKFSLMTAENFIKKIIVKKLQACLVIVGKDFRFGNKRKGNISLLKNYGKIYNFKVMDMKILKEKNIKISSTKIRSEIKKGNFEIVRNLLGRFWSIKEKVIQGRKVGRSLGIRTANIEIKNSITPKLGVYAVKMVVGSFNYKGVANFGFAPTFARNKLVLEINLFKKIKSIYGKIVEVFFIKRIRNEKKFKNKNLLIKQIKRDIYKAKQILK